MLAACVLDVLGVPNTEARERSSIFSATADALEAYTSEAALAQPRSELRCGAFVRSGDTVYVHAPAESGWPPRAGLAGCSPRSAARPTAPTRPASWPARVLFALDEVANVAPIAELPQIASEGGGQGLLLLASSRT